MDKMLKEDISYIQEQINLLCAILGGLTRKDMIIDNPAINELIASGVDISMVCQGLLDTTE